MNNNNQISTGISEAWVERQKSRIKMMVIALVIMVVTGLILLVLDLMLQGAAQTTSGGRLIATLNMNSWILFVPFVIAIFLFWGGVLSLNNSAGRTSLSYKRERGY